MAREKKKKPETQQKEDDPETQQRKKLKKLAYSNNLLSHTPAKGFTPLNPSKIVTKHHGTDILKKSQRKNRYLFSFNGLLAPISGGKIGELTDLGSKNPSLYLDFPQGRMKLFGTIVYPQNRYLTLQFSRGGKNVMCEDWFDTMIVFSDACWVGTKEENPEEARLDFPKELYEEKHQEFDFKGGVGSAATRSKDLKKVTTKSTEEEPLSGSPTDEMQVNSPERHQNPKDVENSTPVRQSGRTAGRKFNFAEVSSGDDDSAESVSDMSGEVKEETAKTFKSRSVDEDRGHSEILKESCSSKDTAQVPLPKLSVSATKESSRNTLVQATISTLFKKVEEKNTSESLRKTSSCQVSSEKVQLKGSKSNNKKPKDSEQKKVEIVTQDKKREARGVKRKAAPVEVEDDDMEESSSASEDIDESDEDW